MKNTARIRWIKIIIAAVVFVMLFIPSSVNHPQIDMRALVAALGIDAGENGEVIATVEIILPKEGGGASGQSGIVEGKGKTLSEAFEDINISLGRKLELNHCGIIVFGKEMAQIEINPHLEYLLSAGLLSPETNLTLSGNETAAEFIEILLEYSQKLDLSNLLRYTDRGAQNYSKSMVHYLRETYSKSRASAMPCITMGFSGEKDGEKEQKNGEKEQEGGEKQQKGGEKEEEGGGDKNSPVVSDARKTAAFKDGKLAAVFGKKEALGMAWLDKKTTKGYVFLEDLSIENTQIKSLPLRLDHKKVKIKTEFIGEQAVFTVDLKLELKVEDKHRFSFERFDKGASLKKAYPAIKDAAKKKISGDIAAAFEAARAANADIFMIEDAFFRFHHREYKKRAKDGYDFLAESKLQVNCKINLS